MGIAADVAVSAAQRVEQTAGLPAGLLMWRKLAASATHAGLRARAILGGLRCAVALRDHAAIDEFESRWPTVDEGIHWEIFAICKEMVRARLNVQAVALARAEIRRLRTASALYMFARCLDVCRDARAGDAFAEAISVAQLEGATVLVHASRVRRAFWLSHNSETLHEAIEEAKKVTASDATASERLVLAKVLLASPSRFVRAGAIGLLDDVATTCGRPQLSRRAVLLAAQHADAMQDDLTPLEADRLLALFSREPMAAELRRVRETVSVIARIARATHESTEALERALAEAGRDPAIASLHERARDILGGRFEPVGEIQERGETPFGAWACTLDAVVALRDRASPRAITAVRELSAIAERGQRVPPAASKVVEAALGTDDVELRGAGGRLAAALLAAKRFAPPRGWLDVATALAGAGMTELATRALRKGLIAKERGAAEALVATLTRSAYQLAESGNRIEAIARLREARSVAQNGA